MEMFSDEKMFSRYSKRTLFSRRKYVFWHTNLFLAVRKKILLQETKFVHLEKIVLSLQENISLASEIIFVGVFEFFNPFLAIF